MRLRRRKAGSGRPSRGAAACVAMLMTTAVPGTAALAQMSALDIVANTRLQGLMRLCQQQVRDELRLPPDQVSTSPEFRASYMECMRDQRAGFRVGQ